MARRQKWFRPAFFNHHNAWPNGTGTFPTKVQKRVELDFDTNNYSLRGTELEFSDGSTMRNDFHDILLNPKLKATVFAPVIPTNYTIVEPLKKTH